MSRRSPIPPLRLFLTKQCSQVWIAPRHPPFTQASVIRLSLFALRPWKMVAQRGSNRIHYRRRHSYNTKSNSVKPYVIKFDG